MVLSAARIPVKSHFKKYISNLLPSGVTRKQNRIEAYLQIYLSRSHRRRQQIETLHKAANNRHALLIYLNERLHLEEDDPFFHGHTNKWECREIARTLCNIGFNVDAVHHQNDSFSPERAYDIVIDIHGNLERLLPMLPKECRKVVHATGSYVPSLIAAETSRLDELQRRRGALCRPRRSSSIDGYDASLAIADHVSLIGNAVTLATYPKDVRAKTSCIDATASVAPVLHRTSISEPRAFLWLGGGGSVLKGLDLLLEVFGRRPDIKLHIVGRAERDFAKAFRRELFETDNISYHGFLDLTGERFRAVAEASFAFIKPSASEGMSTAVTTAMNVGLYPIISRQTGIDLPTDRGMYLQDLTPMCD